MYESSVAVTDSRFMDYRDQEHVSLDYYEAWLQEGFIQSKRKAITLFFGVAAALSQFPVHGA